MFNILKERERERERDDKKTDTNKLAAQKEYV